MALASCIVFHASDTHGQLQFTAPNLEAFPDRPPRSHSSFGSPSDMPPTPPTSKESTLETHTQTISPTLRVFEEAKSAVSTLTPMSTAPMQRPNRMAPRTRQAPTAHFSSEDMDASCYEPCKVTAQGYPVNNKIKRAKYATSVDDRGYLSVYEFQLNDQTIMWDYATGFVHLTGIWKSLGNSKADIVRLVDNHPELEGVIRRIRGGFLKIQGTWVPYELCRRLATRTCYTIRHALISVFGANFPDDCLKPNVKGYGTLTLDDSGVDKKRKKRKAPTSKSPDELPVLARNSGREKRPRMTERELSDSPSPSESCDSLVDSPDYHMTCDDKTSPPPLPRILDLSYAQAYPSKLELLELLQATRSLQKLSTGSSKDWNDEGGHFNLAGTSTTFHWDGSDSLAVVEDDARPVLNDPSASQDMPRKFSTTTQCSSLGPMTPPQLYQQVDVHIRQPSPLPVEGGLAHVWYHQPHSSSHQLLESSRKLPNRW